MPLCATLPFKTLAPIAHRSRPMAAASGYPKPMTPPYPAVSKEVELRRAMTAAARSGAFELSAGDVVFEDESMVVVNKPSGIYCETLLKALASKPPLPADAGNETCQANLHLANRLDRDTSGLMVITKSHKVAAKLVKAFTDHKVKKTYIALCIGNAPKWKKLTISSGHGRSKFGAWRVYSKSDVGRALPGGSMVKDMTTSLEVLSINGWKQELRDGGVESIVVERMADESTYGEDELLIRAFPQSGRTHQIRLHCQYLGVPIRGDVKYGGVIEWKGVEFDFHALHAESLSFDHPVTGFPLCFHSPLPPWAKEMDS
ncbi:hypothetical protein J5N97_008850 [Dioscorea zingiberensis]|uniref:Pseudouridine synthase RsuA/RluA-like domain-containing protein n=1 Tax=Dioscorea zingiberensis TaxID=325984 RepID=A0A9D5HKV7_9LILI|nr:hypothetical protein J5N97_008850 [Dioscorea zingiberensis]